MSCHVWFSAKWLETLWTIIHLSCIRMYSHVLVKSADATEMLETNVMMSCFYGIKTYNKKCDECHMVYRSVAGLWNHIVEQHPLSVETCSKKKRLHHFTSDERFLTLVFLYQMMQSFLFATSFNTKRRRNQNFSSVIFVTKVLGRKKRYRYTLDNMKE
jgi:hypothetical protein